MSYIYAISTAVPENKILQIEISDFMSSLYDISEEDKKKIKLMYARSGIQNRYSVLSDFADKKLSNLKPKNEADIATRMKLYFDNAPMLAANAIQNLFINNIDYKQITHFITVSCTGMAAPGLDILLVKKLGLKDNVQRTSVNFMGCYAAFHALKMADAICKSNSQSLVLIVCVELCTLHFQSTYTTDNIAANLLFGDGAAACIVGSNKKMGEYKIKNFYSKLIFKGESDMAWHIGNTGFLMTLSAYIPQIIEENIIDVFADNHLDIEHINWYAIHPGGRKILDKIKTELKLKDKQIESSYKVLKNYGNMSSPTILFVLNQLKEEELKEDDKILAAGFGPGLTIEMLSLEVC